MGRAFSDRDLFVSRLSSSIPLSPDECEALRELANAYPVRFARGEDILRDGELVQRAYVVVEGWAMWQAFLSDGGRQVYDFILPGDTVGLSAMVMEQELLARGVDQRDAASNRLTITALTDVLAIPLEMRSYHSLLKLYPRLAMLLLAFAFRNRSVCFRRRIECLGRRSALARTADLLLELWQRERERGTASADGFHLPVSQAVIGDLLGIAPAYLNRILKQFQHEGVIAMTRQGARIVTIRDPDRLRAAAAVDTRDDTDFDTSVTRRSSSPQP